MAPRSRESAAASKPLPFEHALERLEEIVDQLEDGELDLETSLKSFEEGVRLSRQCAQQLEQARQRIEVLVAEDGEWVRRAFEDEDAEDDDG